MQSLTSSTPWLMCLDGGSATSRCFAVQMVMRRAVVKPTNFLNAWLLNETRRVLFGIYVWQMLNLSNHEMVNPIHTYTCIYMNLLYYYYFFLFSCPFKFFLFFISNILLLFCFFLLLWSQFLLFNMYYTQLVVIQTSL